MIEIPEALVLSKQINDTLKGKTIVSAIANASPHKFAFYNGNTDEYPNRLKGKTFLMAQPLGGMVDIIFDNVHVVFTDGVNLRYHTHIKSIPSKHQLLIVFSDNSCLTASV